MREQLNFPLPSKSCLLQKLAKIDISPGILWPVLRLIKEEFTHFTPLQRAGIICFDEVSVDGRASLDLKNEKIMGPHKNMMAITVRGLAYKWKQVIFYDFDVRLTKEKMHEIIGILHRVGVHVYGMVSDMSTINRRLWKELGIKVDLKNEENCKYNFKHPITEEPIWLFADFPHLLKLLRNHFLDKDVKLGPDFNNAVISVKVIQKLIDAQKSQDLQLTFNLSEKHKNE